MIIPRRFAIALLMLLAVLAGAVVALPGTIAAQTAPPAASSQPAPPKSFLPPRAGVPSNATSQQPTPPSGIMAWLVQQQRSLNQLLAGTLRDIKDGRYVSATLLLMLLSFGYGIVHAAGPGHGKAIVSSYVLADGQTVRRGVILAFMSALVQALSAIVIFTVVVLVVKGARTEVQGTEVFLERASWAIVALFGAWLLLRQLRSLVTGRALHDHAQHDHAHHDHGHHGHAHHDHAGHDHSGHSHLPGPEALAGAWSLRRALALAVTVGIRPCTGAIGVLFFANAIGVIWAGILATFAMALGTAITVSALVALAVGSRDLAARLAGAGDNRWAGHVQTAAGLIGAALVLGLGVVLFFNPLSAAGF